MDAKQIFKSLLEGYTIAGYGKYGFRLRDAAGCVVIKIHSATFDHLRFYYLRQTKNRLWIVDKRKIRSLHGNHAFKKLYKSQLNGKNNISTPKGV